MNEMVFLMLVLGVVLGVTGLLMAVVHFRLAKKDAPVLHGGLACFWGAFPVGMSTFIISPRETPSFMTRRKAYLPHLQFY